MDESTKANEFAGTPELVGVLAQISKLRMAYPDNKRIAVLAEAANKCMDADLCQAVLLQMASLQEDNARQRQSPLAKMMNQ